MTTIEKTICTFDELSKENQAKAIDNNRDFNTEDSFWYESTVADAKTIGELLGIDMENVYFRGFWSQGDGACFTGSFCYRKGMLKAVKGYAPADTDLHTIARDIQTLHRKAFYRTCGKISHRGHYCHERSMSVDADNYSEWQDVFADLARWIYRNLEREHEYQTSDEVIADSLRANEVEFQLDENGTLEF